MKYVNKGEGLPTLLHHNMAVVGGFLGAYAILNRAHCFGNALTMNLMELVLSICGRNWIDVILRFLAVCLYLCGMILFVVVTKKTKWNIRLFSIIITTMMVIVLAFIPEDVNPVIGLFPIFFAMSIQWNAFQGEQGFYSSTIFSSNNTRQVGLSLGELICTHDKKHLKKTFFFLGSILGYHIGVTLGYFAVKAFAIQAVWFSLVFIASGAVLATILMRREQKAAVSGA